MKIIIDTCIWSEALRKNKKNLKSEENNSISQEKIKAQEKIYKELKELIFENRIIMLGLIRQELLSGIKDEKMFELIKEKLKSFEDYKIETEDYEQAAKMFNVCRKHGIQGSNTDYLICSIAVRNNFGIFTTDDDFKNYEKYLPILLHKTRKHGN